MLIFHLVEEVPIIVVQADHLDIYMLLGQNFE